MTNHYPTRCIRIRDAMLVDNWPRLHSPVERGQYAMLYCSEMVWRLVWGADKGSVCPDLTGTAYAESWYALRKANEQE